MDLDQIKQSNPIQEVINEDEPLRGRGRWLRGEQHDSLVCNVERQSYYWNSKNEWGDVIEWVRHRRKLDFRGAVEWLCDRAGLPRPSWNEENAQATLAARVRADTLTVACRHWVRCLRENVEAMEYARSRGWTDETIQQAGLGYVDGDTGALRGELQMHGINVNGSTAAAVLRAPKGHLVYPHVWQGRVVYFSTRLAAERKGHWNPPTDLAGERRPFFNHEYAPLSTVVVVVEGQADAVTLGQWGMAAVALSGTATTPDLLSRLGRHQVILGLDADPAGQANTAKIADALGPMTRIVCWPEGDANAWLQSGASDTDAQDLVASAPIWVEMVARDAGQVDELGFEEALRQTFGLIARMDDFAVAMHRGTLIKALGIKLRQFNALLKAARGERAAAGKDDPDVLMSIPGGYIAEHLLEMVVIPPENSNGHSPSAHWQTRFACRFPDGQIGLIEHLDVEGVRFLPMSATSRILTEGVVQFPSAIGESRSLRDLAQMVRGLLHKYMDVDIFYEHIATYYVLFTWLYDSFNTLPYLRMLGDAGTGKSRFIQVVGAMCYRPTFVTGAATVSPIFRILDRYGGTLVLDEADYKNSDESADIIKILNTGYQRIQGQVLRSGDKHTGFEPEVFVVYGPKVIATRRKFADWALESRCLTNESGGPTTRADIPIDLPRDFWRSEAVQVRNALLRFRLERWQPEIELDYAQVDTSVEPRLNQVTVALQTLIDDADLQGDLRAFIQEYNRQLIIERGMTLTAKVLEGMVGLYEMEKSNGVEPLLTMGQIARAVNVIIDTENRGEQAQEADEDGKRKQITPHKIGQIVRKQLHLRTERSSHSQAGRAYIVVWDAERIQALRKRFGLEDDWLEEIVEVLRRAFYPSPGDEDIPPEAEGELWEL
jgi:hypothetical protein